jgi:hypothetical protein
MLDSNANVDRKMRHADEATLGTGSQQTSFQLLVELIPSCVEPTFQTDLPHVLTCERRCSEIATNAALEAEGVRRIQLHDGVLCNLHLFRSGDFDDELKPTSSLQPVVCGSPLQGFDPVVAQISIRDTCATGKVRDCAAVNLAKFIIGPHGVMDETIELPWGSRILIQVKADLISSTTPDDSVWTASATAIARKEIQGHGLLDVPTLVVTETLDTKRECELVYKDAAVMRETDPSKDVPSCHYVLNEHDGSESAVYRRSTEGDPSKDVPSCHDVPNGQGGAESTVHLRNTVDGHADREQTEGQDRAASHGECRTELRRRETVNLLLRQSRIEQARGPHEELCSPCDSSDEEDVKHFGALREIERDLLPDHPFRHLVTERRMGEIYSTISENGVCEERALLSFVNSPFPICVWSIQGPDMPERDPEQELRNIGDGVLVPNRNIQKLKAAAEYSSTKSGPPAMLGNVSPLQLTYILPTKQRAPLVVELGKPWRPSQRTVLNASRWMRDYGIKIDEPILDDSDESEERDSEVQSADRESEDSEVRYDTAPFVETRANIGTASNLRCVDETESTMLDLQNHTGQKQQSSPSKQTTMPNIASEESVSRSPCISQGRAEGSIDESACIRESASRLAELTHCLNDADAAIKELKHLVKRSESTIIELRSKLLDASLRRRCDADNWQPLRAEEQPAIDASEREWLIHTQAQNQTLVERDAMMMRLLQQANEARDESEAELWKLQREVLTDVSVRYENERLLKVILDLKTELDHEPGSPDVVNQLREAKSENVLQRQELGLLRNEIAKLKRKCRETASKHAGGLFLGFYR